MNKLFKVAILGAESTGKSQLAHALVAHLQSSGHKATAVDEYLREWCDTQGRTPQAHEQAHIALVQQQRIEQAASDLIATPSDQLCYVIADTTPLMTAVYSEFIFQDTALHASALAYQHSFDLTLLTGLDMPWQADGMQRDGAHVRPPVDALLRRLLEAEKISYEVIYGQGEQRLSNALRAIERSRKEASNTMNSIASHADSTREEEQKTLKKWQWNCEKCSDPDCEHRLFRRLQLS